MIGALGIVIRTSVLLACVSLLSLVLRRASASVRHALWVVALLAALASPIASGVLPEWDLAILPANNTPTIAFNTTPPQAPAPKPVTGHVHLDNEVSPVAPNSAESAAVR